MTNDVKKILGEAIHAPSGDNSQPWRFNCKQDVIELINIPDRDNPIFNYLQRGSFVAHGAVIQNIKMLAPVYGYEATETLFPDKNNTDITAVISLSAVGNKTVTPSSIQTIIKKRCTNRKKYNTDKLKTEVMQRLLSECKATDSCELLLTEDANAKKILSQSASTAERVMLEYRPLHDAFFSMIRWNAKEENEKKGGLYINTLELLPPQRLIFKWFSKWRTSKILRLLGFPSFIAKENSKIYESSAAIGAIVTKDMRPESFVHAGMLLQKIWLAATELNLSLQPIAGVLYLGQRLQAVGMPGLPHHLTELITNSVSQIYTTFHEPNGNMAMMFRIGESEQPSARSSKFSPMITYNN